MYKRIVFHGFLSMFFLSAILGMHFSRLATANPIPVPSLWMPYEYIDAKIFLEDGVVRAEVDGTYPFIYPFPFPPYPLTFDQVVMYYPIPPDADIDKITVEMDETKLDWTYSNETYPTALGDWPMINWTIEPVPECFEINTYYEHSVPVIGGNNTFLYAMGTGRYLDYYAKNTTAYVKVSISKDVADSKSLIDVYTIGYNTAIEEWIWKPADYAITQEDETWIVTLTVISEMFHPLEEDLLITIKAESRTWTVDDDGPADFHTIQEAINAANPGDTILVSSGTYYENVVINKTVTLIGENSSTTFIDGNKTFYGNEIKNVVNVTADNVHVSGFTIQNGSNGIWLTSDSSGNTITGNTITSNKAILLGWGIIVSGVDNIISNNMITSNRAAGILLEFSENATISGNTISNNDMGVILADSRKTALSENTIISNDAEGVSLYYSSDNTILDNTISNHEEGIRLWNSSDNTIYHNNLMNNTKQAKHYDTSLNANTWDNGAEGNYWSDYTGEDLNGDGIGDTDLPHQGVDGYPLIIPRGPIPAILDGVIYPVSVLSNSTVSRFDFSHSLKQISFNVTGPDGTTGFCRVAIPKNLLWLKEVGEVWIVTVDGRSVTDLRVSEDSDNTYLYFTYTHSVRHVEIRGTGVVPEFSTWTPIILILILLTVAIAIYKRRLSSKSFH